MLDFYCVIVPLKRHPASGVPMALCQSGKHLTWLKRGNRALSIMGASQKFRGSARRCAAASSAPN
jgi:hypothetical protein